MLSLPSRERGLKWDTGLAKHTVYKVAPFAGAWIEIKAGDTYTDIMYMSLPSRERGLKLTWH